MCILTLFSEQTISGSQAIVGYLYNTYGVGVRRPLVTYVPTVLNVFTLGLISALRPLPMHGRQRIASIEPKDKLVVHWNIHRFIWLICNQLYNSEASPACRIVRETLSCMEIPYIQHNSGVCIILYYINT